MSKESFSSPYKPIFRETLNNAESVRKNGGTPTAVTFNNGVASFINGRHRFTVIRDMGKSKTAMNVEFEDPYLLRFIDGHRIA